ncbi:MAG: energy-coupling factor ABC transporter ATP-binding protein [Bifidobacterium sp.]|nr:energy-coupling factor ABC transporter ATP-binding protein [Bifidobacterium sp.]
MGIFSSLLRKREPAGAGRVDFRLDGASYRYDDGTVGLEPTSLELGGAEGGHTAVIGLNGAGKSTLVGLLGGALPPTGGTLEVVADGEPLSAADKAQRRRIDRVVGVVDANALPHEVERAASLEEGLMEWLKGHGLGLSERTARTGRMLLGFDLAAARHLPAPTLDQEHRHLLAAAVAASRSPAILVADEPTSGLDERGARHVASRLLGFGIPVVFTTHDVDLTLGEEYGIGRTLVMDEAHVVFDGAPEHARSFYTQLIRSKIQGMSGASARRTAPSTSETLAANSPGSGSSESAR